jgi:hypothetical protein
LRVLRWLGGVAAVLLLIVGIAIWRLMQGPIELDRLAPYVEAALDRSGIGLKIRMSGARFAIDRRAHQLEVWAEDVHVSLPSGEPVASFPEMAASFDLGALMGGRLALTQLVIEAPLVYLSRDETGAISARIRGSDQAEPGLAPAIADPLNPAADQPSPLGALARLRVHNATIIVDDQRTGRSWQADHVAATMERTAQGLSGELSLALPIGPSTPELLASYRYAAAEQTLDLDVAVDGIEPAAVPPLLPELAQLRHLQLPVSGTLKARIDLGRRIVESLRIDLAFGKGRLQSEWLPTDIIAVEKGELHAVYVPAKSELQLERLLLELGGGTSLVLDGVLSGITPAMMTAGTPLPAHVAGKLGAALKQVPLARFASLWPTAFSPGGRRWVLANVRNGVLDEASVKLALDIDAAAHTATVLSAAGALRYHNLTIIYLNGLPPVQHVNGTASFSEKHLDFAPTSGSLKGLRVTGGSLRITELGSPVEWLTIDLAIGGPLRDVLEVLDMRPLSYAHAIGIEPSGIAGRADAQLHFKLPLLSDLKVAAIDFGAKAMLSGASVGHIAMDKNLTDGNLALDLSRAGAHVRGTARVDGIPSNIDANVYFKPKSGPRAVYRIGLSLDSEAQRRFALDLMADRFNGPVGVELTYSVLDAAHAQAVMSIDLKGAALSVAEAGWTKAPGAPATAKVVLDIEHDKLMRLPQIEVRAAGLDGRFVIMLGAGGTQVERVDIQRLIVGDDDLSGVVTRRAGSGWHAEIHAARLDGRPLLRDMTTASAAPASAVPLAITARIDRLTLGPRRDIEQVSAELLRSGGGWQSARVDGRFGNGRRLALRLGEAGAGRLRFQSEDLGATVKLLDIADNVVGGRVTIDGQLIETAGKRSLRGHVEGENYTLVQASAAAQILSVPSFTGIASLLSGSGLPFSTLRGDFVYNGNLLTIEHLLAYGESLGITADGWVDLDRDRVELRGTVAPAYALNSMIGNVPLIGPLLGGGSEGLFAANYRLSGPSANPEVTVNPLSALAPGFLRQLFAPILGAPAPQQAQRPAR